MADTHVIKLTLETAQLACSAHYHVGGESHGYWSDLGWPADMNYYRASKSQRHHPFALWTQESETNYQTTVAYGLALSREYTRRFGKVHKCHALLEQLSCTYPVAFGMAQKEQRWPVLPMPFGCTPMPVIGKDNLRDAAVRCRDAVDYYSEYARWKVTQNPRLFTKRTPSSSSSSS
jgi:hypothetical protein